MERVEGTRPWEAACQSKAIDLFPHSFNIIIIIIIPIFSSQRDCRNMQQKTRLKTTNLFGIR